MRRARSSPSSAPAPATAPIAGRACGANPSHRCSHAGRERAEDGRHVKFGVVRQHAHRVARQATIPPAPGSGPASPPRPRRTGKTSGRGEHGSRVTDRHHEAEHPGDLDERPREINGPKTINFGGETKDSTNTSMSRGAPRRAGRSGGFPRPALEHGHGVTGDDAVQFGVTQSAQRRDLRTNQEFAASAVEAPAASATPVTETSRPAFEKESSAKLPVDLPAHQSSGSTKRCTVPPQVSPTAKAWSSE